MPAANVKPLAARAPSPGASSPPVARTVAQVDTIFRIELSDPYRWMEGAQNPEFEAWLRAHGAYARSYLDSLPGREKLFTRIRELGLGTAVISKVLVAGGRAFYLFTAPGAQLPVLRVHDGRGERTLVDPARLGRDQQHASINGFAASPDGSLVAYDLSLGGGEISSIHVLDVATGRDLPDVIDRVWGEFTANWLPDGKAFFYTQMAPSSGGADPMLEQRVRLHVLGEPPEKDVLILARGLSTAMPFAPEEFPIVTATPGSQWLVALGVGARQEIRIAVAPLSSLDRSGAAKTPWRLVAEYADHVASAVVHGDRLYLESFKGAPNRRVISLALADARLADARVEVPESQEAVLQGIAGARDGLYVREMIEGRARLLRLRWTGGVRRVALPYEGWIDDFATDPLGDGAIFALESWTRPGTCFTADGSGAVGITVAPSTTADFSKVAVQETSATSSDGTVVPLTIVRPANAAADGSHPTLLAGYGGYGISITPAFVPNLLAWLEHGGIFAVCHVRGGGEKGFRWQVDGTHENKMNGVHDFEACGQELLQRRLTSRGRLFGRASSMGGILIGRAITERPDLFAAVNIGVGITNPVRLLHALNGANQKGELGDPETEAGFKSIYAMDPYHHVRKAPYPAVIFTVGVNDKRVSPWMTGKMAAKMLASTTSGRPILIRIDEDAGHGIGSTRDQYAAERADVYSFFLAISGDQEFAPAISSR